MGLDSRYVLAPSLQEFFIDKDSGLPLSNGSVFFFVDGTNIPKPVYEISGVPPNFSYTVLPNPSILSAVGTFVDASGNDIVPYYFPFDSNGNIQLYTIAVYNSDGVLQFTREGWPNTTETNAGNDVTNFVGNGQFLMHNDIPASTANGFVTGQISLDTTQIAQGGWSYERSTGYDGTDIITFPEFGSIQNPTGNPRYACQITTTVASTNASRKDLCLKFPGVNTFASSTQFYNFYFEAKSLSGQFNAELIVRKFFGTGGTPTATSETAIGPITITNTNTSFNEPILFGVNTTSTLGTNNDDYVQIIIRLPLNATQSVQITNACITLGTENLNAYPSQTESQQIAFGDAGYLPVPNPDGFSLYLPIVQGQTGFIFDDSNIGKVFASFKSTPSIGELNADGAQYLVNDYSTDGIPFRRLFNKYFDSTLNAPIFGTGSAFVNCYVSNGLSNQLIIATNQPGAQTNPTDGAVGTTFTFKPVVFTGTAGIGYTAYANANGYVSAILTNSTNAVVTTYANSTSTFSGADYNDFSLGGYRYLFRTLCSTAAGLAGLDFFFSTDALSYYMWFKVDGVGADPAPGGRTGILVNLLSTMNAADVANCVANALSGRQVNAINTVAASSIPNSSYFTFNANSNQYVVWYNKGNGIQPVVASTAKYIEVDINPADSAAVVATKTQIAINSLYFAVPNLNQGVYLTGVDANGIWDVDVLQRYGYFNNIAGTSLGSFEPNGFQNHVHDFSFPLTDAGSTNLTIGSGGGVSKGTFVSNTQPHSTTNETNAPSTRPTNVNVNWVIKY